MLCSVGVEKRGGRQSDNEFDAVIYGENFPPLAPFSGPRFPFPFSNSQGLYLLSNPLPTPPAHTHTFSFLILSPMKR